MDLNEFLGTTLQSKRMDHRGIGWKGVDWMQLAEDRAQW
jgi:hypothetical protein